MRRSVPSVCIRSWLLQQQIKHMFIRKPIHKSPCDLKKTFPYLTLTGSHVESLIFDPKLSVSSLTVLFSDQTSHSRPAYSRRQRMNLDGAAEVVAALSPLSIWSIAPLAPFLLYFFILHHRHHSAVCTLLHPWPLISLLWIQELCLLITGFAPSYIQASESDPDFTPNLSSVQKYRN